MIPKNASAQMQMDEARQAARAFYIYSAIAPDLCGMAKTDYGSGFIVAAWRLARTRGNSSCMGRLILGVITDFVDFRPA